MTYHAGTIPAGTTIPIPFTTYAGSTGASATCTGLAVTDIEIYKDGSTTQRSSDAGIDLLDTDGIDFDGITGLHGFEIDLSENTDSGFYAVGSFYWVVVSAITVDSQTVTFLAATFRIGPAESITGYPKSDVHALKGDAQSATDLKDFADTGYDPSTHKVAEVAALTGHTAQTGDSYAIVASGTHGNAALKSLIDAVDNFVDTEIADIQSRIPASLTSDGMMKADMLYVNGTAQSNGDLNIKLDAIPTNSELATALAAADDATLAAIAALNDFDPAADVVAHVTLVDTVTINTDMVGEPPTVGAIVDGVWDEVLTGHVGASSAAVLLTNASDKANEIAADWADGGRLDLILDARASQSSVDTLAAYVDTEMASVLEDTGTTIPALIAGLLTTAMTESYRADGATGSVAQLLYEIHAEIGEFAISGTTKQHLKLDGATNAFASILSDATNPAGVTRSTSA